MGVGGLFLTQMDRIVLVFSELSTTIRGSEGTSGSGSGSGKRGVDTVVMKSPKQDFHAQTAGGSFGGINNVAHPGGAQEHVEEKKPYSVVDGCTFSPEKAWNNSVCSQKLYEKKKSRWGERTQGRLLMFGDSTMKRLSFFVLHTGRALTTLQRCYPTYRCARISGTRCDGVKNLQQQRAAVWNPPNISVGEGPCKYGVDHPFCSDCIRADLSSSFVFLFVIRYDV